MKKNTTLYDLGFSGSVSIQFSRRKGWPVVTETWSTTELDPHAEYFREALVRATLGKGEFYVLVRNLPDGQGYTTVIGYACS